VAMGRAAALALKRLASQEPAGLQDREPGDPASHPKVVEVRGQLVVRASSLRARR